MKFSVTSYSFHRLVSSGEYKEIELISLAEREEVFTLFSEESIRIDHRDHALKMLQRSRDEAHRFAITYHRSLRGHKALLTQLDQIPGIGPARRKALLKAYPVQAMMKEASVEELMTVPGITEKIAQQVYELMHSNYSQKDKTQV